MLIPLEVSIKEVEPGQNPLIQVVNKFLILQKNTKVIKVIQVNLVIYTKDLQPIQKSSNLITLLVSNT